MSDIEERLSRIETALGGVAYCANEPIRRGREKLRPGRFDEVEEGPVRDALHMLAALVFDLIKKMECVFEATHEFMSRMDPDLLHDIEELERKYEIGAAEERPDYVALAERLERLMLDLWERNEPRYEELLDQVRAK